MKFAVRRARRARANQAANQRSVGTRSANSTRSGGPPLATRSKAASEIGHAQPEGERLARPDREGGDGPRVGVADDAAAIEDEAGIGQRLGEELDAGFRPDRTAGSVRRRCRLTASGTARGDEDDRRTTAAKASNGDRRAVISAGKAEDEKDSGNAERAASGRRRGACRGRQRARHRRRDRLVRRRHRSSGFGHAVPAAA